MSIKKNLGLIKMKKANTNNIYKKSLTELQIDMDRVIGHIERYFTKTSIVLGAWGIIISLFCNDSVYRRLSIELQYFKLYLNFKGVLFFVFTIASFVIFIVGIINLIITLIAKAPASKKDSKMFYVDIATNKDVSNFKNKILHLTEEQVRDDYINQIYINAVFCKKKNKHYNRGLFLSSLGFSLFIVVQMILLIIF